MTDEERPLRILMRHIRNVQDECELLAERLIEQGRADFARMLISNSMRHDNSKFSGIEWEHLNEKTKENQPLLFACALKQHQLTNPHHPEYWGGIASMPEIYVAELVCDWKARSAEFGTGMREWVKMEATKRWDFTMQSKVYKTIKGFVDLLLDQKFS